MAGRELGFPKPQGLSLKEQLAKKTLRNVRLLGHSYVDLREDGKRYVFFCTLCLAPCYSEAILFDHLGGNLHKQRYAAAKDTLMGENPWPFNDGMFFFHNSDEQDVGADNRGNDVIKSLDGSEDDNHLAVVVHSGVNEDNGHDHGSGYSMGEYSGDDCHYDDDNMVSSEKKYDVVIPGVIGRRETSDLRVRLIGHGKISARFLEKNGVSAGIRRIWCEWLGKRDHDDEIRDMIPMSNFAVVTFAYYYDLGKQGLFDDIKTLLLTNGEDRDSGEGCGKRKKRSNSNPEDISESLRNQCDSSGEDSQVSSAATSGLVLDRYDDQLLCTRIVSNKKLRREMRRQWRVASKKMCDICRHKMLPGKDVGTLLNLKTGRLACSSRNVHGAFHIFHISCLVHWLLLCEFEMFMNPPVSLKVRRRSRRKVKSKVEEQEKECGSRTAGSKRNRSRKGTNAETLCEKIQSVFCPDCQGTGVNTEGDELEKPTVSLTKMFDYQIKMCDGRRSWMNSPENLQNCSTGFTFPLQVDDTQEKVAPMKLLRFYRADEEGWQQDSTSMLHF